MLVTWLGVLLIIAIAIWQSRRVRLHLLIAYHRFAILFWNSPIGEAAFPVYRAVRISWLDVLIFREHIAIRWLRLKLWVLERWVLLKLTVKWDVCFMALVKVSTWAFNRQTRMVRAYYHRQLVARRGTDGYEAVKRHAEEGGYVIVEDGEAVRVLPGEELRQVMAFVGLEWFRGKSKAEVSDEQAAE